MARDFNGTSQYLEGTTWRGLPAGHPLSIGAIVRIPSHSDYRSILALSRESAGGFEFGLTNVGRIFFYNHGGGSLASSTTATPTGAWMFVGYAGTSATGHRFYCRNLETGLLIFDETASTTLNLTSPSVDRIRIGADGNSGSNYDFFPGPIQQVVVWDMVLDSADFANLSRRICLNQIHAANVKAFWRLSGTQNPERDGGPYGHMIYTVADPARVEDWPLKRPTTFGDILRFALSLENSSPAGNTYDVSVSLAMAAVVAGERTSTMAASAPLSLLAAAGPARTVDMTPPAIVMAGAAATASLSAADMQALLSLAGQAVLSPASQLVVSLAFALAAAPDVATVGGNEFFNTVDDLEARAAVSVSYVSFIERTMQLSAAAELTAANIATLAESLALGIHADIQRTSTAILNGAIAAGVSAAQAQSAALVIEKSLLISALATLQAAATVTAPGDFAHLRMYELAGSILQQIAISGSIPGVITISGSIDAMKTVTGSI